MSDPRIEAVLRFWFGDSAEGEVSDRWFNGGVTFDEEIREQFGDAVETALGGGFDDWPDTPRGWLALLILLDQFPRNIYRNTARAFAGDERARTLALAGIVRGDDRALSPLQRVFCYLPLEHAEDMTLQDRSVALFTALRDEVDASETEQFDGYLDYARRHREVIARFGRFPHRNAALGRDSTEAERAYLAQPDTGF